MNRRSRRLSTSEAALVVLCLGAGGIGSGCGYRFGHAFDPEIRSVHVPIFTSKSPRRNLEFLLTEAVQKRIQDQSRFRLVGEGESQTVLRGEILDVQKKVLSETRFDDPRELQVGLVARVTWEDVRTGQVLAQREFRLTPAEVQFVSQAEFAPEVGQSLATAYQQVVDRMARDIVEMMETPW